MINNEQRVTIDEQQNNFTTTTQRAMAKASWRLIKAAKPSHYSLRIATLP